MSDVTAHFEHTRNCRVANCPNEAKTANGIYAYLCDEHISAKKRDSNRAAPSTDGLAGSLTELRRLARQADRLTATAKKLTEQALAAKANAERTTTEYRRLLRETIGE